MMLTQRMGGGVAFGDPELVQATWTVQTPDFSPASIPDPREVMLHTRAIVVPPDNHALHAGNTTAPAGVGLPERHSVDSLRG